MAHQGFLRDGVGKWIIHNESPHMITRVDIYDKDNEIFYVYYKDLIDGRKYFRSDEEAWCPRDEEAEAAEADTDSAPNCQVDQRNEEAQENDGPVPKVVLEFVHNLFKVGGLKNYTKLQFSNLSQTEEPEFADTYDESDIVFVNAGDDASHGKLYCGQRTLFTSTRLCKSANITKLLLVHDGQTGGICQDSAIRDYPEASQYGWGEYIMTEIRWIFRQFLPPFTEWSTMEELIAAGPRKVIAEIGRCLNEANGENWAMGCGRGRSRSAAVLLNLKVMRTLGPLLVTSISKDELQQAGNAIQMIEKFSADSTTTYLSEIRDELSVALRNGPGQGQSGEMWTADRQERFLDVARCFLLGRPFEDGKRFLVLAEGGGDSESESQKSKDQFGEVTGALTIPHAINVDVHNTRLLRLQLHPSIRMTKL